MISKTALEEAFETINERRYIKVLVLQEPDAHIPFRSSSRCLLARCPLPAVPGVGAA